MNISRLICLLWTTYKNALWVTRTREAGSECVETETRSRSASRHPRAEADLRAPPTGSKSRSSRARRDLRNVSSRRDLRELPLRYASNWFQVLLLSAFAFFALASAVEPKENSASFHSEIESPATSDLEAEASAYYGWVFCFHHRERSKRRRVTRGRRRNPRTRAQRQSATTRAHNYTFWSDGIFSNSASRSLPRRGSLLARL